MLTKQQADEAFSMAMQVVYEKMTNGARESDAIEAARAVVAAAHAASTRITHAHSITVSVGGCGAKTISFPYSAGTLTG